MIIKIKSRKKPSYHQLLDYILHDKDRLFDRNKQSFCITHNLTGSTIEDWVQEFKTNENFRQRKRSDSVYLFHEILSWHKDDAKEITLEKLEDMAREYIKLRNPGGMYVAVPHFDKQHYHIHICASGIDYRQGKSLRLEKKALQELKQKMQQYQIEKFPELSKSIVNYDKTSKKSRALSDKAYQVKLRTGRATQKEVLQKIMELSYTRVKTQKDFFELLKGCGAESYVRDGKIAGVVFQGRKYRLKRLGFSFEKIEELSREVGLRKVREKKKILAKEILR